MFRTEEETKVNKMKLRMTAVVLIFALAAWLPAVAQQSSGSQPATARDSNAKQAGTCCDHKDKDHSCCHDKGAKNGKAMACCKEHAKGDQTALNCCCDKGDKLCAKDGKDGKSCCGKDAAGCNTRDGKNCCGEGVNCPGCAHS